MATMLTSDTQLNRFSYYEASVERGPALAAVVGDRHTDVVVVGAGFAGLSAAIDLAAQGLRVVVLEADKVCSGASGRNGGQAIVGYACGQGELERQLGRQDARHLWQLSLDAVDLIDQRIADHRIDCDRRHGYIYVADKDRKVVALRDEVTALSRDYGFECRWFEGGDVGHWIDSKRYVAGAYEEKSGHLHPLKYGLGLLAAAQRLGVQVFEHSPVVDLVHGARAQVKTQQATISADFVVLAANCTLPAMGPRVAPAIAPRIMPVGTYMVATEPLDAALVHSLIPTRSAVCDNNFVLDYFRFSADNRLLFGGEVSYTTHTPPNLQAFMRNKMVGIFPQLGQARIAYTWGGFVDISMNRAPDFGRLATNVYYLQGFSGHGVALPGLAGRMVSQAITQQASSFDVFAKLQHRPFPGGALLRTPTLAAGMLYHRLREWL
jgi:gamma-glutamylputrescine oxidase